MSNQQNELPVEQIRSPAGHNSIAYLPSCDQLISLEGEGNQEVFGVYFSSGEFYPLATREKQPRDVQNAALDAEGICKNGGVEVPIVSSSQTGARIRIYPTPPTDYFPLTVGITCGAIATLLYLLYVNMRRKK